MEAILEWLAETDNRRYSEHEDILDIKNTTNKRAAIPYPRLRRWVAIVAEMADLGRTDQYAAPAGRDKIITNEVVGRFLGRSADWVKLCSEVQRIFENPHTRQETVEVRRGMKESSLGLKQLYDRLKKALAE